MPYFAKVKIHDFSGFTLSFGSIPRLPNVQTPSHESRDPARGRRARPTPGVRPPQVDNLSIIDGPRVFPDHPGARGGCGGLRGRSQVDLKKSGFFFLQLC